MATRSRPACSMPRTSIECPFNGWSICKKDLDKFANISPLDLRRTTWLDEEQLPSGLPCQKELKKHIGEVRCALVFIGREGTSPWQDIEIRACLDQLTKRRCPVIPVILPDAVQVEVPSLPTNHWH